jgi:hypothetical protein
MVSWAIFAHLLIGLFAGYFLLADRSRQELVKAETLLTLRAGRAEAAELARELRAAGATRIVMVQPGEPPGRRETGDGEPF